MLRKITQTAIEYIALYYITSTSLKLYKETAQNIYMEPAHNLPSSQKSTNSTCTETNDTSPHPDMLFQYDHSHLF